MEPCFFLDAGRKPFRESIKVIHIELCGANVRERPAGTGRSVVANRIARRVFRDGTSLERWTIPTTRRVLTRAAGLKQEAVDWDMMFRAVTPSATVCAKSRDSGLRSVLKSFVQRCNRLR